MRHFRLLKYFFAPATGHSRGDLANSRFRTLKPGYFACCRTSHRREPVGSSPVPWGQRNPSQHFTRAAHSLARSDRTVVFVPGSDRSGCRGSRVPPLHGGHYRSRQGCVSNCVRRRVCVLRSEFVLALSPEITCQKIKRLFRACVLTSKGACRVQMADGNREGIGNVGRLRNRREVQETSHHDLNLLFLGLAIPHNR